MKYLWLLQCDDTGVKFLFHSLENVMEQIRANTEVTWTIEAISIYDEKLLKTPNPNVTLNTESGKVDEKKIRIAPVPLNRSGDVE